MRWLLLAACLGVVDRGCHRRRPMTEEATDAGCASDWPGVGVRYPGRREPALADVDLARRAGERVGVTGRTGAGKSTLALAAGGFIPRVVRAKLTGGSTHRRHRRDRDRDAGAPLLGRVGDRLRDAGQSAVRLEADRPRGARLRPREPGRAARRDGRPDRRRSWRASASATSPTASRSRCPAASSNGSRSRASSRWAPTSSSSTSRRRSSIRRAPPTSAPCSASWPRGGTAILCVEHDPTILGAMDRVLVLDRGASSASTDRASRSAARRWDGRPAGADARPPRGGGRHRPGARVRRGGHRRRAAIGGASRVDDLASGGAASVADPLRCHRLATDAGRQPTTSRSTASSIATRRRRGRPRRVAHDRARRGGRDPRPERVGQDDARQAPQRPPPAGDRRRPARRPVDVGDRVDRLAATVGFVFQNPDDQLFERSVEREVAFGPRNLGMPAERVATLVDGAASRRSG